MNEPVSYRILDAGQSQSLPRSKPHDRTVPGLLAGGLLIWCVLFGLTAYFAEPGERPDSMLERGLMVVLHLPFLAILLFLVFGLIERFDYFRVAKRAPQPGVLPSQYPRVCVQLPMFNEDAVAERIIRAAAALEWPREALEIQVLDDSTDLATQEHVREVCESVARDTGIDCQWIHREDRRGYKAGALEEGRKISQAEYFAILDADFLPPADFLARMLPHFYDASSSPIEDLAVVQAQWGHLNDDESFLTRAQALWVDDHHTLQKTWRTATIGFVNFTGTAGVWKAKAIEDAGGWKAASLVEDCELSVRALFAGYRTRFVGSIVAPAELPQSVAAYRSQQKRWTQGWAQLQRLHMPTLMFRYPTSLLRRIYLIYFASISWQWFLWTGWIVVLPFLIANGLWLGAFGVEYAIFTYVFPPLLFTLFSGIAATYQAKPTYRGRKNESWLRRTMRLGRVVPFTIVNTGMMPHHFCAFLEGMFGPLHAEFVRTPKTASTGASPAGAAATREAKAPIRPKPAKKKNTAALVFETFFVYSLAAWATYFVVTGQAFAAFWSVWIMLCILGLRFIPAARAAWRNRSMTNAA
jgi:cellulose synthase/poly-beta-1,6-N-acetylglucosamine synthase-like glycosyltransferase